MNAIKLAILFHDLYEKYAPEYGYETKDETKIFKAQTPNGQLMIRVCREIQKIERFRNNLDITESALGISGIYAKLEERADKAEAELVTIKADNSMLIAEQDANSFIVSNLQAALATAEKAISDTLAELTSELPDIGMAVRILKLRK